MKKYLIPLLSAALFTGCVAQSDIHKEIIKNAKTYDNFRGFEPVDAIEFDDNIAIRIDGKIHEKQLKLCEPDQILAFLNNETVLVSVGVLNAEGKIAYLPVTVSSKGSSYKVTMDYMKFATITQKDENNRFIGWKRVGVGLRLISLLTTLEGGINIGDLSSIGMAAKAGKLNGTMMIEVIGIKSKEVTTLIPFPSEINQTTIQTAMQALATIKSKVYDGDTRLFPQVMAIKLNEEPQVSKETLPLTITYKTSLKDTASVKRPEINIPLVVSGISTPADNKVKLQIENRPANPSSKMQKAAQMENEAFENLFAKDVAKAITSFEEIEKIYPGFHSAYEISRLLKQEAKNLSDQNSANWKSLYKSILENYSWKLSPETKNTLKLLSD